MSCPACGADRLPIHHARPSRAMLDWPGMYHETVDQRAQVAALLRRIVAMGDRGPTKLAREALRVLGLPPI